MRADIVRRSFRRAGYHCHRRFGRIMAVFHTRRLGLLAGLQQAGNRRIQRNGPANLLQRLQRQSAGPQQTRRKGRQIQNRGLHPTVQEPPSTTASILPVHILQHILGAGAAGSARGIGAGGGDGRIRRGDNRPGNRMIRTADPHRIQARPWSHPAQAAQGRIMVSGPGQNVSARRRARGGFMPRSSDPAKCRQEHAKSAGCPADVLSPQNTAHCSAIQAIWAPRPYTVSVGIATRPPLRSTAAAPATASPFSPVGFH